MYGKSSQTHTRPIMIMLIVSWIIIIGGVIWFIMSLRGGSSGTGTEITQDKRWFVGENVLLRGELSAKEGLGSYTHDFVARDGTMFGARSTTLDLGQYIGSVEVKGTISSVESNLPIILVEEVVRSTNGGSLSDETITLQGNPSLFYDLDAGLMIDLGASQGFEVVRRDGSFVVVDRDNNNDEVLNIESFTCRPGDALQDCTALRERFVTFNNDSFTNGLGVTFYNLTETNTWFAFNGDTMGYTVRASEQRQITTFGSLFGFISRDIIEEYVDENITVCRSLQSSLESIDSVDYDDRGNGILRLSLNGTTTTQSDAVCNVAVKLGSPLAIELLSYRPENDGLFDDSTDDSQDDDFEDIQGEQIIIGPEESMGGTAQPSEDTDDEGTDNDQEPVDPQPVQQPEEVNQPAQPAAESITPPSSSVERPESFDGWLQYTSIRGFVMWFSRQGVSYFGEVMEDTVNLGMDGVSCDYKVHVINWTNADDVVETPDVIVYECTGIDPNNLPANTQLVGTAATKQFVTQWFTNNLAGMDIFVEDLPESDDEE